MAKLGVIIGGALGSSGFLPRNVLRAISVDWISVFMPITGLVPSRGKKGEADDAEDDADDADDADEADDADDADEADEVDEADEAAEEAPPSISP